MAYKYPEDDSDFKECLSVQSKIYKEEETFYFPLPLTYTNEVKLIQELSLIQNPYINKRCVCGSNYHKHYLLNKRLYCPIELHENISMRVYLHVTMIPRNQYPIIYTKYKLKEMQIRYASDLVHKEAINCGLLLLQDLCLFRLNVLCIDQAALLLIAIFTYIFITQ